MSNTAFDRMTVAEQIDHVQSLWDRIAAHPENIEVSEAWRQELARRSAEARANPASLLHWDEVRANIRARLGEAG